MDLYIMNKQLQALDVIDYATSVIWTTRYYEAGDFELYVRADKKTLNLLQEGNMIYRLDDKCVMIIEKIQLTTDAENGDYIIVSGECVKSILKRRIVWTQTSLKGTVLNCLTQLINQNVINPSITSRKLSNFSIGTLKGTSNTMTKQVTGDNLYDVVVEICKTYGLGWEIEFNLDDKQFYFNVFSGVDRSYNNTEDNPRVVFSEDYDNLIESNYTFDKSNYANVGLVAGEGEGLKRKTQTIGTATGWDRYEVYVDAKDISQNSDSEDESERISDADYNLMLQERGYEKFTEHEIVESFEGTVEPYVNYNFNEDYFLGDIVEIQNAYGNTYKARITEFIETNDENGLTVIPTFVNESEVE